jgi:hypothetical protein
LSEYCIIAAANSSNVCPAAVGTDMVQLSMQDWNKEKEDRDKVNAETLSVSGKAK